MRVAVFTTSYPRNANDFAGRFIADAVRHLKERGVEMDIVAPGVYKDFGLTGGDGGGLISNVKRRPWLTPALLLSMAWTLRRHARGSDLVHAHWLAGALIARFAGKPFVVTLHGSTSAGRFDDFSVARRWPGIVRWLLAPATGVICVSSALAEAVRACGVERVEVIPNGVEIPETVSPAQEPPHVLFVGRLSPEKNIDTLAEATAGIPRVIAGDGPERHRLPDALGFVPHERALELMRQAAAVIMPGDKEGFGVVAAEAMAEGRPVVAAAANGLLDLVVDGETGLLVPPRDAGALREAILRLLNDADLRDELGRAARERAQRLFGWSAVCERTLAVYRQAQPAA